MPGENADPHHNNSNDDDAASTTSTEGETAGLFDEPEGFYPPTPPPTTQTHGFGSGSNDAHAGRVLTLNLVGHSPLEGHHLWNGARVAADLFEADPSTVRDRTVLELGAGAGLPGIVAGLLGARRVVITDFPDWDLLENLRGNVRGAGLGLVGEGDGSGQGEGRDGQGEGTVVVEGFVWGGDPEPLLAKLPKSEDEVSRGFDVIVMADLLFRHSEHGRLLDTIEATMRKRRESRVYVVFTSYRPWLQHKDLAFFDVARERGFEVEKVLERKMDRPLFENDPGDEEILKTVMGFTVRWPAEKCEA